MAEFMVVSLSRGTDAHRVCVTADPDWLLIVSPDDYELLPIRHQCIQLGAGFLVSVTLGMDVAVLVVVVLTVPVTITARV